MLTKLFLPALLVALLSACSSGLVIDRNHPSANQDERVQFVVLHYTAASEERSLALLTHGQVSAHYLVGSAGKVYQLVDESRRAWHAGDSQWDGRTWLNSSSIGIEIVNAGYRDTPQGRVWYPYSEAQIVAIEQLLKDIVQRHQIAPRYIVGHSDIAPARKLDPGPLFPWERLARAGLGVWPDPASVARLTPGYDANPPTATWYQQALSKLGYALPSSGQWDEPTRQVLAAFQMHFRASRYDGQPDAQSAAILQTLNSQRYTGNVM